MEIGRDIKDRQELNIESLLVLLEQAAEKKNREDGGKRERKRISCPDTASECFGPSLSQDTSYYLLSPAKVARKQKTENYSSVPQHNEQKRRRRPGGNGGWPDGGEEGFARGTNLTICVYVGSCRHRSDTTPFRFCPFFIFRSIAMIFLRVDNLFFTYHRLKHLRTLNQIKSSCQSRNYNSGNKICRLFSKARKVLSFMNFLCWKIISFRDF